MHDLATRSLGGSHDVDGTRRQLQRMAQDAAEKTEEMEATSHCSSHGAHATRRVCPHMPRAAFVPKLIKNKSNSEPSSQ